jgi:hypothetical protein
MTSTSPPSQVDIAALARAIRFALVCLLLGLCYLNLRCTFSINACSSIFKDMLGGKPLPASTVFVLQFRILFASISVVVPFCAVLILFTREMIRSFYAVGLLALLTLGELVTVYCALLAPFKFIIQTMGGNPSP